MPRKKVAPEPEQPANRPLGRVGQPGNHAGREWPAGVSGNPNGRPKGTGSIVTRLRATLEGRLEPTRKLRALLEACTVQEGEKAVPGAPIDLPSTLANVMLALALDESQAAGDRAAAIRWITDRSIDGPVALKVEGLSESQMRAWALRVGRELQAALPVEHHQAIAEAILRACGDEPEREVEAEPTAALAPAP